MDANRKPTVLIVDDEEMVLTSIRTLLLLEGDYDVRSLSSPHEAVNFLRTQPVDVAVSDFLMPGMTGIQLLAQAKQLQPEATRVLLTGHADKASAIQAINEVPVPGKTVGQRSILVCHSARGGAGAAATRPPHEDLRARHGPFDAEGRTGAAAEGISVITWRVRIPQSEVLVEAEFELRLRARKKPFPLPGVGPAVLLHYFTFLTEYPLE